MAIKKYFFFIKILNLISFHLIHKFQNVTQFDLKFLVSTLKRYDFIFKI